jgi:plasmid stabilization system protein ParE
MAAKLIVAPEALADLAEAYAWYEARRVGLGEEFLGSVDACIEAICRMPEMHEFVHENCRRALVRRFPYAVFYEHAGQTVTGYLLRLPHGPRSKKVAIAPAVIDRLAPAVA